MFIECAQDPLREGVKPYRENELFLNARGLDRLRALEAIALGSSKQSEDFGAIGYYDFSPLEPGAYTFSVSDMRRVKSNSNVEAARVFSVDTAQIVVFDLDYLDGVLDHFSWKHAYSWFTKAVSRRRERKNGQRIAGRDDVYVQIQAPGKNSGTSFIGDGEYFFREGAFQPANK